MRDLVIHTHTDLRHIGEAYPEIENITELARLEAPWRQTDVMQRTPEFVASPGVVGTDRGRPTPRRGSDEDYGEPWTEKIG